MPSPPELPDIFRNVRILEILSELKSEHLSESDRHIGISAEIKVNLERKCQTPYPCGQNRKTSDRKRRDLLVESADGIGKHYFFCKSHDKIHNALSEFPHRHDPVQQLCFDIHIAHDRSRDQLREHTDVQCKRKQTLLRFCISAVNVDQIR